MCYYIFFFVFLVYGEGYLVCFLEWIYIDLIFLFFLGDELDRNFIISIIWYSMLEFKIDNEEVERFVMECFFSKLFSI